MIGVTVKPNPMSEKTNQWTNGDMKKRQHEVIPKGKKLHWCEVVRCWILIDKSLTKREAKAKEHAFTERYQADEWKAIFK